MTQPNPQDVTPAEALGLVASEEDVSKNVEGYVHAYTQSGDHDELKARIGDAFRAGMEVLAHARAYPYQFDLNKKVLTIRAMKAQFEELLEKARAEGSEAQLRDQMAMAALCLTPFSNCAREVAERAYQIADAMMTAR